MYQTQKVILQLATVKSCFLGCDDNPTSPAGVSMYGEVDALKRLTHKRIKWLDLPEKIREHIKERYTRED